VTEMNVACYSFLTRKYRLL